MSVSEFQNKPWFPLFDGRPVEDLDRKYFKTGFGRSIVIVSGDYHVRERPNEETVHAVFSRAIECTPILCTKIMGEGDDAIFRVVQNKKELPPPIIHDVKTNEEVNAKAEEVGLQGVKTLEDQGQEGTRYPGFFILVRGPARGAIVIVFNHCFLDGMSVGMLVPKLYLYWKLPRLVWPVLDMFSSIEAPTFMEMVLKKDYNKVMKKEIKVPGKILNNLFPNFESTRPEDIRTYFGEVGTVPWTVTDMALEELRQNGVTLTSAFSALAGKVLLRMRDLYGLKLANGPISISTSLNARSFGTWKPRKPHTIFCEGASYAFPTNTEFTQEELEDDSLVSLAKRIRYDLKQVTYDSEYRYKKAALAANPDFMNHCRFGCSSMRYPAPISTPPNFGIHMRAEQGKGPEMWFIVSTYFRTTSIRLQARLPNADIDDQQFKEDLMTEMMAAAEGTPLEHILKSMGPEGLSQEDIEESKKGSVFGIAAFRKWGGVVLSLLLLIAGFALARNSMLPKSLSGVAQYEVLG